MPCADIKLDEYHAHEALDRTNMIMEILETHLLTHPHIQADPQKVRLVEKAAKHLMALYQHIGNEHL